MTKNYTAPYLFRQPRSPNFYFRFHLPQALQKRLGQKEVRYSLGTADKDDARYLALELRRRLKRLFEDRIALETLTKEHIDQLMKDTLRRGLEEGEDSRAAMVRPYNDETLQNQRDGLWSLEMDFREQLALCDYGCIRRYVDDLLADNKITGVDRDSVTYGTLCRELLKVHIRLLEIEF